MQNPVASPADKPRSIARDRHKRNVRIMALIRAGWSRDAIAQAERLTGERVRQIVAEMMEGHQMDEVQIHMRVQTARLDEALRLATARVAEGDLRAIDRLLRVMDRLDKYQRADAPTQEEDEEDDVLFDQRIAFALERAKQIAAQRKAEEAAAAAKRATEAWAEAMPAEAPAAPAGAENAADGVDSEVAKFFQG